MRPSLGIMSGAFALRNRVFARRNQSIFDERNPWQLITVG
jgi:hypothetical protein